MGVGRSMNKKCMSKVGTISLVAALIISATLFASILFVSAVDTQYLLGEKIKIDIGDIGEYTLVIQTPNQTFLQKSTKSYFIYQPTQPGQYTIEIKSEETKKEITFQVKDNPVKKATTEIPIEEVTYEKIQQDPKEDNIDEARHQIVVGSSVKWKKKIQATGKNIQIKIPESSTEISLHGTNQKIDFKIKKTLTDTFSNLISDEPQTSLIIANAESDFEVEYLTPAPEKKETILRDKKKVEVSSEIHYENVLVFTNLTNEISPLKEDSIVVFWIEENKFLDYQAFDKDGNGLLDYVEWIAPHLSTQTFEIIVITKADHLDQNKQFVEEIYETVKEKDNIWQSISANHYVRVVFEKLLNSQNDITIFAKSESPNASIEVYEKDGTEKIAEFGQITKEGYYKIFLTNLISPQDTFDLRIIGGTIIFDLIIDPLLSSTIIFESFESTSPNYYEATGNWTRGSTAWDRDAGQSYCGSASAHIDAAGTATNYITLDSGITDLSGASNAIVSFWWWCDRGSDTGEMFSYDEYYSGSWNNDVYSYEMNPNAACNNNWIYFERTLPPAALQSDFQIRFAAETNAANEDIYIDCLNITREDLINTAPTTPTPQLNSTTGTNLTTENLNCFETLSDPENDNLDVSVRWYKNDALILNTDYNNSYPSSTLFNAILPSSSTSEDDIWKCSMRTFDGALFSSWTNSSTLSIVNPGVPIAITIDSPTPQSYPGANIDINISTNKATDSCWYSLDGTTNASISKVNTTFFSSSLLISGGEHTLDAYCNDTFGAIDAANTTFFVAATQYATIGEWGVVQDIPPASWNTVYFEHSFDEVPVVVHQIDYGYDYDNNPCTTRVRAITEDSFQIRTDSWSETSSCPATGIDGYWLAMEKGVHNVSNAGVPQREVEAASFTMDVGACGTGAPTSDWTYSANHRQFQNSWSSQPLVLSAVQTANDVDPISQYMRGCTTTNSDTWNTTCIEIGLNGMENDGAVQPCNLHTQNEEGGYIAWEMNNGWTNAETRDNTGTSGDGVIGYSWEAYWENDNVAGSQNDPYPMSNYFITLSQSYNEGIALGSGIRVDGANGVFPTVHYEAPSNTVFLLSDEDEFGDTEQQHTPEPYELLFFSTNTGYLFSENVLKMITVNAPINNTEYGSSTVDFDISTRMNGDTCWFSLDGAANQTMNKASSKSFDYSQGGLSDMSHNVIFYCNNTYGGVYSSEQYSFSIDSQPLIVNAISPTPTTYNTSTIPLATSTTKAVTWCKYSLNGATNVSMTSVNSTYFTKTLSYLREADYDLDYYCGSAGSENSTSVSFTVDVSPTENITRGLITIPDGSSEANASFIPQDVSKALLLFSFRSGASGPSQLQILGELTEDAINFRRYSTTGDTYIEWTVIESPELYVQRGSGAYSTGTASDTASINAVNLTESFATISSRLNTGTASQNVEGFWTSQFNSATQMGMSRGTTGSAGEYHWQAAEWEGSMVQSGYISGSGTSTPQALSSTVNTSRSFLTFSHQIAGATNLAESFIRGSFTDGDNIGFSKASGSATHGISWFVVENNRFTTQSGQTTLTGATAINANINAVELNKSFSFESRDSSGGATTFANAFVTSKIFDTTTFQFQKGTGSQTQVSDWFIIELGQAQLDFMSVISPTAQAYSTTTIDFNVSLTQSGDWCAYSLDGAANQTMTSLNSTYFYYTQSGLSSTTHNVTFYCNNSLGTMFESSNIVFSIDMSAPTVTSLSPSNQTTITTNTLYFSYNTTDNAGVDSCSFIANEQVIWTDNSIAMDTTQFFTPYLDNGIYNWYINCTDGGGLTSSSEVREINVSGPATYTWANRFYETSTSDFTSSADISLATSRDATENSISITLPASSVTTVTTARSPYLGNGGAIIPTSTIIDFSGYTTVARNNFGYLTWKLYIENSTGDTLICQSGDDFISGTRMSSSAATWAGGCTSQASDTILKKSDRLKMVLNVYNSDTTPLDFTHSWDDLRLSFLEFMTFTPLGALSTDIVFPTTNISIARDSTTNVTCEASCNTGSCLNTNTYIQIYNGSDWLNIGATGNIILDSGETNPHNLGSVSSAQQTNFTLKGNTASLNDIRCMATSTYSTATGNTIKNIQVQDSNLPPTVTITNPADASFSNTSQISLFYNASDVNDNIANTTLILNGQPNMTNSSIVISAAISNFTISLPDGTYNWTVNVTDSYSATATDASIRTFTIDTALPQITLHNPTIDESLGSVSVFFNFTTTDNIDSDLTCDLTLDGSIIESGFSSTGLTNLTKTVGLGNHLWNVSCIDDAGNTNVSETRNFSVSDTPPIVQLLTANPTWFGLSDVDLEYNVTDNGQIQNCSLYLNGVFNTTNQTTITLGATNEFNLAGVADGTYNWSVSCLDEASLSTSTTNQTFYVDSTTPAVTLNLPTHLDTLSTANVNFNFTATDALASNMTCDLVIDGSVAAPAFQANNNTLTNNLISGLTDGVHTWYVNCTDEASNTGTSSVRTITIEEYPTITLDTPDYSWFPSDLDLQYIPADNTNLSICSLIIGGTTNRTNSTAIINGAQNIFSVDDFTDGTYTWSVNCTDIYGLTSSSETRTAHRDSTAPSITLSTPTDGENVFSGDIEFNFTTTDALSDNMTCSITLDGSVIDANFNTTNATMTNRTNSVNPGTHFWNVTCSDIAGNSQSSPTRNFSNFEAPSVSLESPEDNTWLNYSTTTLEYYIYDSDDNLENCSLYIDGIFSQTNSSAIGNGATNNFTLSIAEGYHNWTVECIDETGLTGTDLYRNLNIDLQAPLINMNNPSQSEILDWNEITFNFTTIDNLDSNLNCTLLIDAFPEITNINVTNNSNELVYVMRSDGDYDWQVQCSDEAGNSLTTPAQNFTIDAPPRITLNSPASEMRTQSPNFIFNYTPEDAAGIIQCDLYVDEVLNYTESTIFPNQANTFAVNGVSEGLHNWSVSCLDADSNTGYSATSTFYRDITPPEIALSLPVNNSGIDANSDATFTWTSTDTLDSLLVCDLIIDGQVKDSSFATSGFQRTELISGLSLGQHTWNVTCADRSGNFNTSETRVFNYTYPDFLLNETSISISNTNPTESESVAINATIYNAGGTDASSVQVKFYNGDPETTGVQIGTTQTISISAFSSNTTSINWDAPLGSSLIFAIADFPDTTTELDETNNKANSSILVESWHFFYGNINPATNFTLTDSTSYELINWNMENLTEANIYVADYDSTVDWLSLQAIGKTTSGTDSSNDIQEIDSALSMTAFQDSHEALYLNASMQINETQNYMVFASQINNVPTSTSINSSNFKTGILWDTSDDSNSEYDATEKEDIVYVTSIQKSTMGSYEIADYELRVPAKLREYDPANQQTAVFYLEII